MLLVRLLLGIGLFLGPAKDKSSTPWTNVKVFSFYSQSRNQNIDFTIYTPPGYDTSDQRYPVLYFLHGRNGNHILYWVAISKSVPEAQKDPGAWLNQLIENGMIPPMIIVAPDDADGQWGAENEIMVTQDLVSYIDSNYRTITGRNGRAIEGFSMGAMGASRYAADHPDLYCSTIIMSDPLPEEQVPSWEANLQNILDSNLRVRLVVGEDDPRVDRMIYFDDTLTSLGVPHQFEVVPNAGHNVGELYNAVGVKGLQFHGGCFEQADSNSNPPIRKQYLPLIRTAYIPE
jgi:enterochelin esterase-like enzyme